MKRVHIYIPIAFGVGLGGSAINDEYKLKEMNRLCKDDRPPPLGGRGYRGKLR